MTRRVRRNRLLADAWLVERIAQIDEESVGTCDSRRIYAELSAQGVQVGRRRVERLARAAGVSDLGLRLTEARSRKARWTIDDVMNVSGPEAAARNYVEQRDVRAYLTRINPPSGGAGCEVGAGFGRVTVVLEEFYDDVVAFERERALVETGASLHPTIRFVQVDSLAELPSNDASFDVALIYTVLQHLTDPEVVATLDEITRVLKPDGSLILCEHIDPDYSTGALRRGAIFTIGRAADHYARLLRDFDLVDTSPRHTQTWSDPGDQGHYMWFRKK